MRRFALAIALSLICGSGLSAGAGTPKGKHDFLGDLLPEGVAARLGTTRFRHAAAVTAIAWAPNGKLLASGGADDFIRLWDPATGKEVRQLKGTSNFTALVFFNDSKTLVSADLQGFVRVWDVESGREFRRFGGTKDRVTSLSLSPDNRMLFTAGSERIVRQWLVAVGIEMKQIAGHEGNILALAVSADGKELRTAADDNVARVFDTTSGQELRRFAIESARGNIPPIAAFSKAGQVLACTRTDGIVGVYDSDNGKRLHGLGTIATRPNALEFSPNGKFLAFASYGGGVRVFGVASGKELRSFDGVQGSRGALAFAPDGQTLATATGENALRLWSMADAREILPLPGHLSAVQSICFSRDGALVFTAGSDRVIRVWDRAAGKELAQFEPKAGFLHQIAPGAGPRSFFTVGFDGALEWSLKDGQQLQQLRKWDQVKSLSSMAVSPDGKIVAVAGADPFITLLDAGSGKILQKLGETKDVNPKIAFRSTSLAISPDGTLLAATGFSGPIQVWNVQTGRLVRQFGQPKGGGFKFAFSPDSKLLAVADIEIRLYEIATGVERQLMAQNTAIRALLFSPDGRYVVAGVFRGGVQYFETATGFPAGQVGDTPGEVRALAISPDGATLASAAADSTVLLWSKPLWREPARPLAPLRLEPAEVDILWKTLAQPDGRRAHQAIWALAAAAEQSIPFLKEKFKPADPLEPKHIDQYIRDLSNANFEVRQRATRELEKLGDHIELPLRTAMTGKVSLEARRRMEEILARINDVPPEKVQLLRALEVLEHARTPESRRVLTTLAEGGPGHWQTDYARQALKRFELDR